MINGRDDEDSLIGWHRLHARATQESVFDSTHEQCFCLVRSAQTGCGAHPSSPVDAERLFPRGLSCQGREANHFPLL
jgi:hypothetical protein